MNDTPEKLVSCVEAYQGRELFWAKMLRVRDSDNVQHRKTKFLELSESEIDGRLHEIHELIAGEGVSYICKACKPALANLAIDAWSKKGVLLAGI